MFAQNVRVHLLLVDRIQFGKTGAQTNGIENGTRTDHLPLGQPGNFFEYVSKYVYGVCHHQINGVRRILHDFRRDLFDDVHVGLRQIDAALSGLSAHAGSDDYDIRTGGVGIAAFVHVRGRKKRRRLFDIQRLGHRFFGIHVDKNDFRYRTARHERVSDRCAHRTHADDCNLVVHINTSFPLFFARARVSLKLSSPHFQQYYYITNPNRTQAIPKFFTKSSFSRSLLSFFCELFDFFNHFLMINHITYSVIKTPAFTKNLQALLYKTK